MEVKVSMPNNRNLEKWLILFSLGAILPMVLHEIGLKLPLLPLGYLPGDLHWQRDGWTVYAPLASILLATVCMSAIAWLVGKVRQ